MRKQTGLDEEVYDYVMKWTETAKFLDKLTDLLQYMLPLYKREGKSQLVIGIGCTGGQHRSVAIAEYLGKKLADDYYVRVSHREITMERVQVK